MESHHYSLVPLGGGASGTVCACQRGDDAVALKIFPGRLYRRTQARLERELATLARLADVVPVIVPQAIETMPDGRCALRMELCSRSLDQLVAASGPLPVTDVLALGVSLASTLVMAHRAGIVHGRVTPTNVLFRESGEPVLSDFEHTLRPVFVRDESHGIAYLAPETLAEGVAGERADLFGLGVVLHLALTGRPPFPVDDAPPVDRPEAPIDLLVLVDQLLERDPAKRPMSAEVVARRLIGLWDTHVPEPEEDSAPQPRLGTEVFVWPEARDEDAAARPAVRADRTWLVVGVPVIVAMVAATVWFLAPGHREITPPAAAPAPSAPPSTAVDIPLELAEPADLGTEATLSWTGPAGWDFAVVVAADAGQTTTTMVQRNRKASITVDPQRKYCFQVQATNGVRVQASRPQPFRGATCRE